MRYSTLTAAVLIALTSFGVAAPEAESSIAEPLAFSDIAGIEERACKKKGAKCKHNRQCCNHDCDAGRCSNDGDLVARACKKKGAKCKHDRQCCSHDCDAGRCSNDNDLDARACRKRHAKCKHDGQCCSGDCDAGRCSADGA